MNAQDPRNLPPRGDGDEKSSVAVCRVKAGPDGVSAKVLIQENFGLEIPENPVQGKDMVVQLYSAEAGSVSWIIIDEEGVIELMRETEVIKGKNQFILPAQAIREEGIYHLTFMGRNEVKQNLVAV